MRGLMGLFLGASSTLLKSLVPNGARPAARRRDFGVRGRRYPEDCMPDVPHGPRGRMSRKVSRAKRRNSLTAGSCHPVWVTHSACGTGPFVSESIQFETNVVNDNPKICLVDPEVDSTDAIWGGRVIEFQVWLTRVLGAFVDEGGLVELL